MINSLLRIRFVLRVALVAGLGSLGFEFAPAAGLRVGAAAAAFQANDEMVIAGGILPGKATGQEGELRAVAIVLDQEPFGKMAIVACDILMITRDLLDPVVAEIEKTTGIPSAHILIHSTHTHHAPSCVAIHGYEKDPAFCREVQKKIVEAVLAANTKLSSGECSFIFSLTKEETIGQNSRLMLSDGTIYWIGPRGDAVRPTGPFDPELPVLGFRGPDQELLALIFNHSTHTIGTRMGGCRSPSFYGLAAQELEDELSCTVSFLQGASGSTHRLNGGSVDPEVKRLKQTVTQAVRDAKVRPVSRLAAVKQPFKFKVRVFDEAKEDEAVSSYCHKRVPRYADPFIEVFRNQRKILAPQQGQEKETWVQALLIGDVAIVGLPAEFFTKLGLDIKNRSPFRYTYIAELSNDWIGYLPDRDGHTLGGYQVWTGLHSYAEPGTGERMVDEVVEMLRRLKSEPQR